MSRVGLPQAMNKTADTEPERDPNPGARHHQLQAWSFVTGQFILLAVLVLAPLRGPPRATTALTITGYALSALSVIGILVAASALGRGLTASPLPNQAAQLRTGGLYKWVRHPIYSFVLMFGLGRMISSPTATTIFTLAVLVALLTGKARWEERRLMERFAGYSDYARTTPRFVPQRIRRR